MIQFEKVTINGINRDISPKALDNGGNRLALNPLIDAENCRYLIGEDGSFEAVQNLRSNLLFTRSLPAGSNTCIGSFFDKWNNQFIYFVHNSNGAHGVYAKSADDTTSGFTTLIRDPQNNFSTDAQVVTPLSFNKTKFVHSISVVDKILFWQYNGTVRSVKFKLDTSYEIANKSVLKSLKETSLLKPSPDYTPFVQRSSDPVPGVVINRVYNNNYQFAIRYVYQDNTISAIGSYSEFNAGDFLLTDSSTSFASILVRFENRIIQFPSIQDIPATSSVKETQILFRRDETDDWKICGRLKNGDTAPKFFQFLDDKSYETVPASETNYLFDSVPKEVSSVEVIKNRVFITCPKEGYDDEGTRLLTVTLNQVNTPAAETGIKEIFYKSRGVYGFGLVFYDEFMRTNGVVDTTSIVIPRVFVPSSGLVPHFYKVTANISGQPPSWARYYSIVRTPNQNQMYYMQTLVKVLYYLGEKGSDAAPTGYTDFNNGKIYRRTAPTQANQYNYIHLQLPQNIPFEPNIGDKVRILRTGFPSLDMISEVLDYDGQVITCSNFGIDNWGANIRQLMVEIYREQETKDERYYEATDVIPLYNTSGQYTGFKSNSNVVGDTYSFVATASILQAVFANLSKSSTFVSGEAYNPEETKFPYSIESPATTLTSSSDYQIVPIQPNESEKKKKLTSIQKIWSVAKYVNPATAPTAIAKDIYDLYKPSPQKKYKLSAFTNVAAVGASAAKVVDYFKANDQARRVFFPYKFGEAQRENVIRYSNTYVEDSNINGLSKFEALNQYTLSGDRTPITRLIAVNNVLLAVHEQNITSMYIGEGFIRQADGTEILTKTEAVIGQDRILSGGYGSKNPESIVSHMGMCFGWDLTKGAVWRYTNAGVWPISDYGLKDHFLKLSRKIVVATTAGAGNPEPTVIKVIGAIDEYNKEFIITFKRVQGNDLVWNDDQTWLFNYEKDYWSGRTKWTPDSYAFNGQLLFAIQGGQFWGHNMDKPFLGNGSPYNNFFGIQYERILKFYVNPYPFKSKVALSMQIAQESLYSGDGDEVVVEVRSLGDPNTDAQITEMRGHDFDRIENVYYGPVLKDKNSLVIPGQDPLLHGDDMRDQVFEVKLTNRTNLPAKLYYINFGYIFSEYSN
jgi:hypothetical protein